MLSKIRLSIPTCALLAAAFSSCATTTQEAAPVPAPAVNTTPFAGEVGMGISYLQTCGSELVAGVHSLVDALEARNLESAREAYFEARAPYEEIEVVARAFPELHRRIDARAYEFPMGELDPEFRGFHRIETMLFSRDRTEPALNYAKELLEDAEALQTILTDRRRFGAEMSFDAMIDRCTELASKTITSEEEMWSEQTLLVIRHGWIGIHSQFRNFEAQIREEDSQLAERLNRAYRQALELIAEDFPIGSRTGTPYSLIDRRKRRQIADATLKLRRYLVKSQETLGLVDA